MRCAAITAVALACIGAAAPAHAIALEWQAPNGCPSASDVRAQIIEKLGGDRALTVTVRIVRERRDRFVLAATIAGVDRRFEGPRCDDVARALVVVVALLAETPREKGPGTFSPDAAQTPTPPPEPEKGPGTVSIATAAGEKGPGRLSRVPVGVGVHLKGGLSALLLAAPTFAMAPGVFIELGRARIEAQAIYALATAAAVPGLPSAEASADFAGGSVSGCYMHPVGAWDLGACGGVWLGALRVETRGITEPGRALTAFGAMSFGGVARWHLGQGFSVFAEVDASAHFSRPRFAIDAASAPAAFYQPAPVSLALQLGADFAWRSQKR